MSRSLCPLFPYARMVTVGATSLTCCKRLHWKSGRRRHRQLVRYRLPPRYIQHARRVALFLTASYTQLPLLLFISFVVADFIPAMGDQRTRELSSMVFGTLSLSLSNSAVAGFTADSFLLVRAQEISHFLAAANFTAGAPIQYSRLAKL